MNKLMFIFVFCHAPSDLLYHSMPCWPWLCTSGQQGWLLQLAIGQCIRLQYVLNAATSSSRLGSGTH